MTVPTDALAVLRRMRANRPPPSTDERCEMCGETIAETHSHVVNVGSRSLMCTCRACYLLFTQEDAALAYRSVPDRYLSFPAFGLTPSQWDDLQIPVGIAFFFRNSQLDRTVAFYPSPAGATESELPLGAWEQIIAGNAAMATLVPDVEAILVRRRTDASLAALRSSLAPRASVDDVEFECFLVPIDACYELVGQMRQLWRGFDGGQDVHRALDTFFAGIRSRSRPAEKVARRPIGATPVDNVPVHQASAGRAAAERS